MERWKFAYGNFPLSYDIFRGIYNNRWFLCIRLFPLYHLSCSHFPQRFIPLAVVFPKLFLIVYPFPYFYYDVFIILQMIFRSTIVSFKDGVLQSCGWKIGATDFKEFVATAFHEITSISFPFSLFAGQNFYLLVKL